MITQMHTDAEVLVREEQTKACLTLNAGPATALYHEGKLFDFFATP